MSRKHRLLMLLGCGAFVLIIAVVLIYRQLGIEKTAEVVYPEGYTVITPETVESNEEIVEKLGYSTVSLESNMLRRGVISLAVNEDNSVQMQLSCRDTDLSAELGSLSELSEKHLRTVAGQLLQGKGYSYFSLGDNVYLKTEATEGVGGNKYCSAQYITIVGGKYYCFNYYGSGAKLTESDLSTAESVLSTLKVPSNGLSDIIDAGDTVRLIYIAVVTVVILLGAVAIILLAFSLIRDFATKRNSDSGDFRIKRRKR